MTGEHHLGQDLVQAALLQAARHWTRTHAAPEAYVPRTMYHQSFSWWRRRKVVETPLVSHDGAGPCPTPTCDSPSTRPWRD